MEKKPPPNVWVLLDEDDNDPLSVFAARPMRVGVSLDRVYVEQYWRDDPEDDATDAAHPAWWRGQEHGAKRTAEALLKIAREGRSGGTFGGPVEEAAVAIQELRNAAGSAKAWEDHTAKKFEEKVARLEARVKELESQREQLMAVTQRQEGLLDRATDLAERLGDEVLKLRGHSDDIPELTDEQIAQGRPAWMALLAWSFGLWISRWRRTIDPDEGWMTPNVKIPREGHDY